MDEREFGMEKRYLSKTLDTIATEMHELDARLTGGIEAANAQTEESITQQFLRRLRILLLIRDKPYFARVDFRPGGGNPERLYIGKSTVLDADGKTAVIDWRAPISTLYYEGRVGRASYQCPDGIIDGEISLKRQLDIENRELTGYNDIDITFDEELLRPYLAVGSSTRLKNIIATIQAEQNRIIRADLRRPLIVQGVAGSGKTTVALHRIAYLIYATDIRPEQFLIIAPNALFLDYISGVLPDLGVENVSQKTFGAFTQEFIGRKLQVEDPGDKLARILAGRDAAMEMRASAYKSSLLFRDAILRCLESLEKEILPREDFRAGKYVLYTYEDINSLFTSDQCGSSFARRIAFIKERLKAVIADNAGRIIARIDRLRQKKMAGIPQGLDAEEYRRRKRQIFEEDEDVVHDLLSGGKTALKTYLKKIKLPVTLEWYHRLLASPDALERYAPDLDEPVRRFICSRSPKIKKGVVEYEDLAPLVFIHNRIHGAGQPLPVRYVVVDEAQDLSAFQFAVLREALSCSSMTIFGDIAQGIYAYRGTNDWQAVADSVFGGQCDFTTLQKSYRSTVEIMEQANRVIARLSGFADSARAVPVIRNGDPVRYIRKDSEAEIAGELVRRIRELQGKGLRNIAVICKTDQSCRQFAARLQPQLAGLHVLGEKKYEGGLSILPSYLAKGLEFDAVLLADAHLYENNEMDIKLLYVAMTRAMHCLDICSIAPPADREPS